MSEIRFDLACRLGALRLEARGVLPATGVTALVGPSGAGKTTLLRCLAGLQRARGEVRVGDAVWQDAHRFMPTHRRGVGYVFQEPSLLPHLSVRANLDFAVRRAGAAPGPGFQEVVQTMGIEAFLPRSPETLSGGERQRVAIARALLSRPALLLMDEPLSSLDAASKAEVTPFLEQLHRTLALPVIYVSHDAFEVARLADRVLRMEGGRLQGPAVELAGADPLDPLDDAQIRALARAALAAGLEAKIRTMTQKAIDASVSLRRGIAPRVGLDRVALIEAVDELGSITAAAKRLGLSYKGAWDIVQGLNNLFETPVIVAAPGGRAGGAARVTERGRAVAFAFRRVQTEIDAALAKLESSLAGQTSRDLFWSLGMRTSARNALRGEISHVTEGAVNSEVSLSLGDGIEIIAILTRRSVEELGLVVGKPAIALIKASFVLLARGEGLRTSARNQIAGVVTAREDGAVNSEIALDIGGGKTLVATVTLESARALEIAPGEKLTALIKAPHVIMAVE